MKEAEVDEGRKNLVLAASDGLQQSDVTVEGQRKRRACSPLTCEFGH